MNSANDALRLAGARIPLAGLVLDLGRDELRNASGQAVELRPQVFQVLRFLALNAARVVTKEELMAAVWPGMVVTDDSLVQAISDLRRTLGDADHHIIKTVPRRGYVLVADAVTPPTEASDTTAALFVSPRTDATAAGPGPEPSAAEPVAGTAQGRIRVWALWAGIALVVALAATLAQRAASPGAEPAAKTEQPMPDRPSIAVLAFRNPGGETAGEQVAQGVAEDLVAELARNVDLRVVSTPSSFSFAGSDVPLAEIGQKLRSRYLVDGTVQRIGELLRVKVELLDSQDGHVVWSAHQDAASQDLPTQRDALVQRIAGSLHSTLRSTEERRALARPPKNLDVYEMTLRAVALKHKFNADATREARALLEKAVANDPNYAPAWLYLGMVNGIDSGLRLTGEWTPARFPEMLAQVQRAIELDPNLPAAYFALAVAYNEVRQFDASLAAMERCVALGPNDADCYFYRASVQILVGQSSQALQSIRQALELSPIPPVYIDANYSTILWANGMLDEAIAKADSCLQRAPQYIDCRIARLLALAELRRVDEAAQEAVSLKAQVPTASGAFIRDAYADSATELRARITAAARAARLPDALPAASQ